MMMDQVRAAALRGPSSASVAEPEKLIVSPTFQVRLEVGELMVGVGASD